jgi:hypothetical protein
MYDILDCYRQKIAKTNRFYKEHKHAKLFSEPVCNWITGEINSLVDKNVNVVDVEKIPHLFRFIMIHFKEIVEFATTAYGLNELNINVSNIQIIKESKDYIHSFDNKHVLKVVLPLSTGDLIISNTFRSEEESKKSIEDTNIYFAFYLDFVYE